MLTYLKGIHSYLLRMVLFVCIFLASFAMAGPVYTKDLSKVEVQIKQELVRRMPSFDKARIEISFRDVKGLSGTSGQQYKIVYPENMSLAGTVMIPVDVYVGNEFKRRVNLKALISIFQRVAVSTSRIRQGEIFTSKNMGYAERDVTHLPSNYLIDTGKALGKQSSTFISKGALILDWMPKEIPAVKKGEIVELFKRVNGVFVKVRAVAVEDGYINGNIRVRNTSSNKVIEGRVISTGEVEAI